jgi:hypothetical protein
LAEILWTPDVYGRVIRGKGVISVSDRVHVQMFQRYSAGSVGDTFEITDTQVEVIAPHTNRLMFTGFSLNEAQIRAAMTSAFEASH